MHVPSFPKILLVVCFAVLAAGRATGCKCGSKYHGKSGWEQAKLDANDATVIFEGVPVRAELQWDLLQAQEGARISANAFSDRACEPRMLVTFRVQRSYKGALGPTVQIKTGLGGGDCGAVFDTGLTYLVFGDGTNLSDLNVNMCSPGGWVESPFVATELRYVRKERPIGGDLAISKSGTPDATAAIEAQTRRNSEEFQRRYAAATGKICGRVLAEKATYENDGILSFLSADGYSPIQHPDSAVNPDGSFCSSLLGPGEYYLYFSRGSQDGPTSASYYPGEAEQDKATKIKVKAGQTESNITFSVPKQKAYSVRGVISTDDKSGLGADSVSVSLISLDGLPYLLARNKTVDFEGALPLPKVKYFEMENVPPGRYVAYVSVLGKGWYTKKKIVNVTTHSKFISLELEHTVPTNSPGH
jgi:hypothetical protein